MCQPKPGPRCSAHARSALDAARGKKREADARREAWEQVMNPNDPEQQSTLRHYRDACLQADIAYSKTLRDYETTPEGQQALRDAITRCEEAGDPDAARELQATLAAAIATRDLQIRDLAVTQQQAARLADPTPAEQALLDQSAANLTGREAAVERAALDLRTLRDTQQPVRARVEAARREEAAAYKAINEATRQVVDAQEKAMLEAKRLYVEAGINERFAGFYANDMVETAAGMRRDPLGGSIGERRATQPLAMKVKRTGTDRDKTLAAKESAETDRRFKAANRRLGEALAARRDAVQHWQETQRDNTTLNADASTLFRDAEHARYQYEDASSRALKARATDADLRARIAAGMGVRADTVPMSEASQRIMRNPDGSINAWVYQPEGIDRGTPARYLRVTDIDITAGRPVLVLENGEIASHSEQWTRSHRGHSTAHSGYQTVHVTPAADGSTPLLREVAEAGSFSHVHDSSG